VLAFVNVYLGGGFDPVLYLHPRFRGDLPEMLTSIVSAGATIPWPGA